MNFQLYNIEKEAITHYKLTLKVEKDFLVKRTKETWLKQGDRCTSFIFAILSSRQYSSNITCLKKDERGLTYDPKEMGDVLSNHFKKILNAVTEGDEPSIWR